ncbi:nitrate/nitrite transporter NrtS [Streptomyces sp. ISL-43]|uniref:nitrate/nitrite transporter NrtS n=1 Tax=Streptomyces sp. ISL-43 TaxID=2819183 RepID=UPI001BE9DCEB|nr:nitrate/nitrite transporter NrtS [Streptomyces sp. ISL-43]MBT2452292.1 nitrate/nitrite transporter NrtS [Streptomyces sp. ISL-43]
MNRAAAPRRRPQGPPPPLLGTVFSHASLAKCIPISLVVGTLLSLVNQGSVLFAGTATAVTWIRVAVNYAVPFCVSSAGFYGSRRAMWREHHR